MLTRVSVDRFAGVPYLETSLLMRTHGEALEFSDQQANVLVGPNGSGKSALLTALAIRFLTFFSSRSTFDRRYVMDVDARAWWSRDAAGAQVWLAGLDCRTDNAPALYYRPGHIPGNEPTVADAALGDYWDDAQEYARLVERKSAGESNRAVLGNVVDALRGHSLPSQYAHRNWEFGTAPRDRGGVHTWGQDADMSARAEVLKAACRPAPDAIPLILLDEPEQSLDAKAAAQLWQTIAEADCRKMQVVAATHSPYPMMHRGRFHLIETRSGFVDEVLRLLA